MRPSLATFALRAAPWLWRQYARDFGRAVPPAPEKPSPKSWPDRGLYASWLGHSTVLLKIDGLTILTDPALGPRAGLRLGWFTLGVKRLVAPALELAELPPIDVILLSHAHMDHFDIFTLRKLENRRTTVVTAHRTSDLLRAGRYGRVEELRWNENVTVNGAEIRAFEVNHWGARFGKDTWRGYNGYLIQAGRYRVLFAGDTAETGAFAKLRGSAAFSLGIVPIGAYNPWIRYHCTPEQAWRMGNQAGAEYLLPVHHATFPLSREPVGEPIERFLAAAGPHQHRVAVRQIGETWRG